MVLSKAKELHHHASELENVVKPNSDVEAWEVAKMERAATDASDVTHYEDGKGSSTEYSEYFAKGGIVIGLVDPNKDKTIKTITLDRNYRESEEEVTKLNEKLNKKSNPKELYWRVIQIGSMAKGGKVGMPEWAVTITSEDGESYDWDGFAKDEDDALNKAEKEAGFESVESGVNMVTDKNGKKVAYKKGGKLSSKAKYIPKRDIEEVEIDQNGKEVELDGADLLDGIYVKKSSYTKKKGAGRPPAKKATGGPVKAKSNRKGGKSVGQIAALAKQIRKEGEKWTDAIKRASAQLKSKI